MAEALFEIAFCDKKTAFSGAVLIGNFDGEGGCRASLFMQVFYSTIITTLPFPAKCFKDFTQCHLKSPQTPLNNQNLKRCFHKCFTKFETPDFTAPDSHNAATWLRKEFGLDVARIILGHRSPAITEIYAELDREKAISAMQKSG